jgi:hypothetical protein
MLLPSCFPFMVGVAAHPEAEEASLQVCYGDFGCSFWVVLLFGCLLYSTWGVVCCVA